MNKPLRATLKVVGLSVLILPLLFYGFILWSIRAAGGSCEQMVIDSNEWISGINIPKVCYANCYYNETEKIRTAIYRLDTLKTSLSQYVRQYSMKPLASPPALRGKNALAKNERLPDDGNFYRTAGQDDDQQWQYVLDTKSGTLWVEIESGK